MATINIGADNAADQFYRCVRRCLGLTGASGAQVAMMAASTSLRQLCVLSWLRANYGIAAPVGTRCQSCRHGCAVPPARPAPHCVNSCAWEQEAAASVLLYETVGGRWIVAAPLWPLSPARAAAQIEGRGNGIKTNVVNNVEVAKALERPADCEGLFLSTSQCHFVFHLLCSAGLLCHFVLTCPAAA